MTLLGKSGLPVALAIALAVVSWLARPHSAHAACESWGFGRGVYAIAPEMCDGDPRITVGTQMTVRFHRLSISGGDPTAGAESFLIRQRRVDGKEAWGGLFTASSSVVQYDDQNYDVTSLRSFLYAPGSTRVSLGASLSMWTPAHLDRDAMPVPGLQGRAEATLALRVKHKSVCRALHARLCADSYPVTYELWVSRRPSPIDTSGAGTRLRVRGTDPGLVSVVSAQHGVVSGDENGMTRSVSEHSSTVHATFERHLRYVVGCGNCLEGCALTNPLACAAACPSAVGDTSWDNTVGNLVPLEATFTQSANYYQVFQNGQRSSGAIGECTFKPGLHPIRYGTGSTFQACKGFVAGTPCQCIPACVSCSCDRVGSGWPRAAVGGDSRRYPHYEGPWYCARMVIVSYAKNEISPEEIRAFGTYQELPYPPMDLGVCGAGCGFYWNVPNNPAMHSLAATSRYAGAYANWRCGGGYLQTVPALYEQNRWYADNSAADGLFDGIYGDEAAPFLVERGAYWARDGGSYLYSGVQDHGWVRYVETADTGAPMPTPAPTQVPSDPAGCPGGPRPVLQTLKPLWEEWCP